MPLKTETEKKRWRERVRDNFLLIGATILILFLRFFNFIVVVAVRWLRVIYIYKERRHYRLQDLLIYKSIIILYSI